MLVGMGVAAVVAAGDVRMSSALTMWRPWLAARAAAVVRVRPVRVGMTIA